MSLTISRTVDKAALSTITAHHQIAGKKYQKAIRDYSVHGYQINKRLREKKSSVGTGWKNVIELLDGAMRECPLDIQLLRGMRLERKVDTGDIIHFDGFIGTTPNRREAVRFAQPKKGYAGFIMNVEIPEGTPYIPIYPYVKDEYFAKRWAEDESEILLARNQQLILGEMTGEIKAKSGQIIRCFDATILP